MKHLKLFFACLLMAVLSIGQMWADNAAVGDVMWAETFNHFAANDVPSTKGTGSGTTVYGSATITYSNTSNVKAYKGSGQTYAGGTEAELYVKNGYSWTISGIPTGGATELTLTYKSNNTNQSISSTTTGVEISGSNKSYTITTGGAETIVLTIAGSGGNTRLDDVQIVVKTAGEGGGSQKTLSSVAVSGAPTKKAYNTGDDFDPAGLTVTGTYSDESTSPITSGITWSYNPSQTLSKGQTTIGVTATVSEISSPEFEVTGLSVTDLVVSNWQVTAPADLTTGDVVVITMLKNSVYYAAPNNGSGAPAATVVAVANSKLSNSPAETLQWTVTVVEDGVYQFSKGTNYLKCTDTNNGVRVGTGDYNTFDVVVENEKSYLHTTETMTSATNGRYLGIYNTQDWRCYSSVNNNIKEGSLVIFKDASAPAAVAKPTISGDENFVTSTTVTLACSTTGADIYYTTDGSDPKSGTIGTSFSLTETATIRAIAKLGSDWSAEATPKTFTKIDALTTMDAIFAAATTAGTTATDVAVTFNNWVVTGVKNSNAYVTDGTKGFIIYTSSHGFNVGDIISGTAACKVQLYNGSAELTELPATKVTVNTGGSVSPVVLDAEGIAALTGVNTGSLIRISGACTNESSKYYIAGVQLYNQLYSFSVSAGTNYECTGVYVQYNTTKEICPRSAADIVAQTSVANPTFTPVAGAYTEVQNVTLSCATDGATVYYTTDGTNPTNESTVYSSAIEVGASMTIKAIAYKGEDHSEVVTAAYTINLPVDENVQKTWDLSIDETATASEDALTWTATYVDMSFAKGTSTTNANNYYPGTSGQSYTSTRTYKNSVITITPASSKQITTVVFTATTSGYATTLKNASWTNATATASDVTVTVTPTNGKNAISAVLGGTTGFTSVQVNYQDISTTAPADPTFSPAAGEYTEVKSVELSCATDGATIYYTTDGSTPDNTSTEYTGAITVDENMTIKAIAYLGEEASGVAEAAYVINLPVSEEEQKTWDLTKDEMASASADELTWTATYVDMSITAGTSTAANNYCPPDHEETRVYTGATLTISPKGKQITTIVFETNGSTPFKNATWTNGTFSNDGNTVTITASTPGNVEAVFGANTRIYSVQVNYGPIDTSIPDAPTFSPAAGTYTEVQTVSISCETEGATIYYTTDGTNPTNESSVYSSAISVGENMTIKAIAMKDEKVSPVATAAYVINLPLSTIPAIFAAATSTQTEVNITMGSWVVSGVGTDEKTVYVTDGTNGFIIFNSDHGFEVGDILSGSITCDLKKYKGAAELIGVTTSTTGLTVTKGGTVTPASVAPADLAGVNTGALISLTNWKYDGTNLTDGTTPIQPFNTLYAYGEVFEENKYYNVGGIYLQYDAKKEILPRNADDIELIQDAEAPAMTWYVNSSKEEQIGASYIIEVNDEFAPYFETNSTGAKTYSSSNSAIAEINETTGVLTLKNVAGSTTIACAVAADDDYLADSKSFVLTVKHIVVDNVVVLVEYDSKWYAMSNATGSATKSLLAVEVTYANGKIWNMPVADQATITWKRTVDGDDVTFQDASDKYLKGDNNGAGLTLVDASNLWNWYEDGGYYRNANNNPRTFFTHEETSDIVFKHFATNNLTTSKYSDLPIVVAAVFADGTPEPPTPVYETVREGLTAGNYYTICYPKAMTDVQGATLWSFVGKDANFAYIEQETATTIEAGKPYIMYATASTVTAVLGDETNAPGANGAIHGTFSKLLQDQLNDLATVAGNDLYLVIGNQLRKATGYANDGITPLTGNSLPANRAFVVVGDIPAAPAPANMPAHVRRMPMQKDVATGFENLNASEKPVKLMIDGNIFILRGEKLYDATGRLVK